MFRLHDTLTRNVSGEKLEIIEESFAEAKTFLTELQSLMEARLAEKVKASEANQNYESPSWALIQADNVGYRRALREIMNLFVDNKSKDTK